jgi:uncharacterized protein YecE (DUF72 family)
LTEYLIGAGGWAYFRVPSLHPLSAYAKAFSFVEVNSTFYQIPMLREAERWRKLVPPDFRFAVRASRIITHNHKLQPTPEALDALEQMRQICKALGADVLHFQTPPSFKPDQIAAKSFRDLISSVELAKTRLALEIRNEDLLTAHTTMTRIMQDHDVVHCVDLSKGEKPAYESDTLYTRLFGKGEHNRYQPTDEELTEIDSKALNGSFQKVVMSFHFVRMYKDAARMKIYKQTGRFPAITKTTGLSSLGEVLSEDASFPSSKQELVQSQGWKLFDLTGEERTRAGDYLQKLPERTYSNVGEVVSKLRSTVR